MSATGNSPSLRQDANIAATNPTKALHIEEVQYNTAGKIIADKIPYGI